MTEKHIIHAYRHLYRDLLRAIQYAKPARYTALYQLRAVFRDKEATYNEGVVNRTRAFLKSAASVRGVEHCVLKNLLIIAWWRHFEKLKSWKSVKVHLESGRSKRYVSPVHKLQMSGC